MRRRLAIAGAGIGLALLVLFAIDPAQVPLWPCPVRTLAGLDCPGCGSLRGMHALLHGQWRASLGHNALLPLTVPLLVWLGACWIAGRRPRVPNAVVIAMLAVVVVFGVARNV